MFFFSIHSCKSVVFPAAKALFLDFSNDICGGTLSLRLVTETTLGSQRGNTAYIFGTPPGNHWHPKKWWEQNTLKFIRNIHQKWKMPYGVFVFGGSKQKPYSTRFDPRYGCFWELGAPDVIFLHGNSRRHGNKITTHSVWFLSNLFPVTEWLIDGFGAVWNFNCLARYILFDYKSPKMANRPTSSN